MTKPHSGQEMLALAAAVISSAAFIGSVISIATGLQEFSRVRDLDPFVLSHAVLGVTGHLAREFVHERSQPVDDVAEAAVAFCLEGLLGGK